MNAAVAGRGIITRLNEARGRGDQAYLAFLQEVDDKLVANMELEVGPRWERVARNWATYRLRHVRQQPGHPPEPLENDLFSVLESARAPFVDNPMTIEWEPRRGSAVPNMWIYRRIWDWITTEVSMGSYWAAMYDLLPHAGFSAGKCGWDHRRRGGVPVIYRLDQRRCAFDHMARLNHRTVTIARYANRVDVGELRDLNPEIADKIAPVSNMEPRARSYELEYGRDFGSETPWTARPREDEAELRETWFELRPGAAAYLETDLNEPSPLADLGAAAPNLVVSWIPSAGIVAENIVAGARIATAQRFRNPDHIVGINDVDQVIGLVQAAHRYQMRGHRFRLAAALPPFILPRDAQVQKKELDGRENAIIQPATGADARSIGWGTPAGPHAELIEYLANVLPKTRRILGNDEITSDSLSRQLTATQVAAVREALETRARGTIGNFGDMMVDLANALMRDTLANRRNPMEIPRISEDGFDVLTPEMWQALDPDEVTARPATDRAGSLTDSGKIAAIQTVMESHLFDDEAGRPDPPIEVAEEFIDIVNPPHAAAFKSALKRRHQARILQAEEESAAAAAPPPQRQAAGAPPIGQGAPQSGAAPGGPGINPEVLAELAGSTPGGAPQTAAAFQ